MNINIAPPLDQNSNSLILKLINMSCPKCGSSETSSSGGDAHQLSFLRVQSILLIIHVVTSYSQEILTH